MFLHIGKNFAIPVKEIIAIIDKKTSLHSRETKKFIETMKKKCIVYSPNDIDEDKIKTYIITDNIIYTSSISSLTLLKRNNKKKIQIS